MSVILYRKELTNVNPEKSLMSRQKKSCGRNNQGKITVAHRGGGVMQKYRDIDFNQRDRMGIPGVVKSIEYDPNRTCFIMMVFYRDGIKRYHLAPHKMKVETQIMTSEKAKIIHGNRLALKNIPAGFPIFNIELKPNSGGKLIRSAGSSARVAAIEGDFALIELPSGEARRVSKECFATIGVVSNIDHNNVKIGKAGRMRLMGRRPVVRGKAKNPIDHPHGGGEGNTPIGLKHPKTPWGMPALGFKTRKKKYSDQFIARSRKKRSLK